MRFQAAHKLVTYLLVLSALAALGTTRVLAPGSAIAFLIVCACSFGVDAASPRLTAALDRAAGGVRAATGLLLLVAIVWRIWRRMPDADLAPAFDLVLVLLGYKLLLPPQPPRLRPYLRAVRSFWCWSPRRFSYGGTSFFVAAFAVYVVLATWALILFHLRREMEENYLVRHSAQAPSQKVGIGRILGVAAGGRAGLFAATRSWSRRAVFVGALGVFAFVPRLGAGYRAGGARLQPNLIGLSDEVALGALRDGGRGAPRRRAARDAATPPAGARQRGGSGRTPPSGSTLAARFPTTRTIMGAGSAVAAPRAAQVWSTRWAGALPARALGEQSTIATAATRDTLAGAERQEIEAVGVPAAVLFAVDRPVAIELPSTRLEPAGSVGVVPRWSGEAALRVGDAQNGLGDGFVTPRPRALRGLLTPARAGCADPRRARTARQPRAARKGRQG